jgi:exopolysaccharide production protein ExoZ
MSTALVNATSPAMEGPGVVKGSQGRPHKQSIVGIQYLRAIAALLVVLDHANGLIAFPKYFKREIHPAFIGGFIGVDIFFVISGFIIAYVTLAPRTLAPTEPRGSFFAKRFSRIVPFMWVVIVGELVLRLAGRGMTSDFSIWPYVNAAILNPFAEIRPSQIWTLREEALFYLIVGFTVLTSRRLWPVLLLWFLSPLIYWPLRGYTSGIGFYVPEVLYYLFKPMKLEFAAGFGLACLYLWRGGFRTINIGMPVLVLIAMSALLAYGTWYFDILHATPIGKLATLPFATLIVFSGIVFRPASSLIDRLWQLAGNASYSIYLTHTSFISASLGFWAKKQPEANLIMVMVMVSLFSVAGGIVVHLFVEKPLIRWSSRLLSWVLGKPSRATLPQQSVPDVVVTGPMPQLPATADPRPGLGTA